MTASEPNSERNLERLAGLALIAAAALSVALTNVAPFWAPWWTATITPAGGPFPWSALHVVNDGLMAIFFLQVGLEIRGEMRHGALADRRTLAFPLAAAVGGMLAPIGIYLALNPSGPAAVGFGIPMATDIAFSLAVLSLVPGVPPALRLFLTTFAVLDDLGAVLVIAAGYGHGVHGPALAGLAALAAVLWISRNVRTPWFWITGGLAFWSLTAASGVHASLSGFFFALLLPWPRGVHHHPWAAVLKTPVTWIILPLFALANTCLPLTGETFTHLFSPVGWGVMAGLVLGKPVGITAAVLLAAGLLRTRPPLPLRTLLGAGMLGGIGFTMSIFIARLSFPPGPSAQGALAAILTGSILAAVAGWSLLVHANAQSRKIPTS